MSAPRIIGTISNQTVNDQATITPFINVAIVDDANQIDTITVRLSDPASGTFTNLGGNSRYNADTGVYVDTGTYASITANLDALVFVPGAGHAGRERPTTFTIIGNQYRCGQRDR